MGRLALVAGCAAALIAAAVLSLAADGKRTTPPAATDGVATATSDVTASTATSAASLTKPPTTQPSIAGAHDSDAGRGPHVTDLVISPDGKQVVACYFVHAMNRPGTDWQAWAAHWDLATGKRTILQLGASPLAVSPDGQHVVMGKLARWDRTWPMMASSLWLWKIGKDDPVRELTFEPAGPKATADEEASLERKAQPESRLLACTFSPDGKEVLAITGDGRLLAWDIAGKDEPRQVDSLPLAEMKMAIEGSHYHWRAHLKANDNRLELLAPARGDARDVYALTAAWVIREGKWSRHSIKSHSASLPPGIVQNLGALPKERAFGLSLPYEEAVRFIIDGDRKDSGFRWPDHLAFSGKSGMVAFREPGAMLATVREVGGPLLWQFPAAAVHAFTPDGKQLVVSERSVLRFYDVATGQIARTLRLDDKPADTVRIAAVQAASEFGKPQANRKTLASLIQQAAARGAQIVVLPETAVTGYADYDLKKVWQVGKQELSDERLTGVDPKDAAETVSGPSTREFAKLARRLGIYLSVPLLEVDRKTGRYYNTIVLLGPTGETLIHYRKLNPWPWAEKGWASEGNLGHPVADTPYGRLGVLICYDIHKQASELSALKVDTLLYSIAWVEDKDSDWFAKGLPEVARTNKLNIVGANWTVPAGAAAPDWYGYGQSTIIDSTGKVLAKARANIGNEIVIADVEIPKPAQQK